MLSFRGPALGRFFLFGLCCLFFLSCGKGVESFPDFLPIPEAPPEFPLDPEGGQGDDFPDPPPPDGVSSGGDHPPPPPYPDDVDLRFSDENLDLFSVYPRSVSCLRDSEIIGNFQKLPPQAKGPHSNPMWPLIRSRNNEKHKMVAPGSPDYEQIFRIFQKSLNSSWASLSPLTKNPNPHYPPVACPVELQPHQCPVERVRGYAFRADGRSFSPLLRGGQGGFFPNSSYQQSLQDAVSILQGKKQTLRWTKHWVNQWQKIEQPKLLFLVGLNQKTPDWFQLLQGDYALLQGTFYDYARLNPYIHTISPQVKEFISYTTSPVVAKGFTRGAGSVYHYQHNPTGCLEYDSKGAFQYRDEIHFFNCPSSHYDSTKWIYVSFVEGALKLPELLSDPWDKTRSHPYRNFFQQEIVVPGATLAPDIVARAGIAGDGRFGDWVWLRNRFLQEDPEAAAEVYAALSGCGPGVSVPVPDPQGVNVQED